MGKHDLLENEDLVLQDRTGGRDMTFAERITKIRNDHGLTQQQFADSLHVTRQAVSNWETGKNLPDIETLLAVSDVYHVSLDDLIKGGQDMNEVEEKLVRDGSENRRAKMNMKAAIAGAVMAALGVMLWLIKGMTPEYIDEQGILHEAFFLLPLGFLLIAAGVITMAAAGITTLIKNHKRS
jgi:transcriptional regulator with XRE-family HTH domain